MISGRARLALDRAAPWLLFAATLGLLLWVSRRTGPAFDELATLSAVDRATDAVRQIAAQGLGELATPAFRVNVPGPALLTLPAAWATLSLGRLGVLDPLTAARLPWLVLGATTPLALYVALRPSRGLPTALFAALALTAMPRWLHAVVVQREGAAVAAASWLVYALYLRSLASRHSMLLGATAAFAFGVACSISLGSAWLLVALLVHFLLARGRLARRLLRRGRVPLPASMLLMLLLAPLIVFATTPPLWGTSAAGIARFALAPLAPSISATEYAGQMVRALPVPSGFAASFVLETLPLSLSLAALAGALTLGHESLARRFASGALRPPRDRVLAGLLAIVVIAGTFVGPALTPRPLVAFPPRVELALPAFALLVAIGVMRLMRFAGSPRARLAAVAITAFAFALGGWVSPATAALAFSPALGGARRVAHSESLPLGDGSELAVLAPALEAVRVQPVRLHAPPQVPPDYFARLAHAGRLRTEVVLGPGGLELTRGAVTGRSIARVSRDGVVVWSLH